MATGDKRPVVMAGDIDKTVAKRLHSGQHAAGGSDPITPAMIGAASVQIGGTEPAEPYTLWFNTGAASLTVATLSLNEDTAGAEVSVIVDGTEYGVENASANAAPAGNSYDFTII